MGPQLNRSEHSMYTAKGQLDLNTTLKQYSPLVRRLAATSRGVHDVTEGSNRVLGLTCCDAAPGFDLASGWGSFRLPDLVALATRPRH